MPKRRRKKTKRPRGHKNPKFTAWNRGYWGQNPKCVLCRKRARPGRWDSVKWTPEAGDPESDSSRSITIAVCHLCAPRDDLDAQRVAFYSVKTVCSCAMHSGAVEWDEFVKDFGVTAEQGKKEFA